MPGERREHPKAGEKADTNLSEMPFSSLDPTISIYYYKLEHKFAKGSSRGQAFPNPVSPRLENGHYPNWGLGGICPVPQDAWIERCKSGKQTP